MVLFVEDNFVIYNNYNMYPSFFIETIDFLNNFCLTTILVSGNFLEVHNRRSDRYYYEREISNYNNNIIIIITRRNLFCIHIRADMFVYTLNK